MTLEEMQEVAALLVRSEMRDLEASLVGAENAEDETEFGVEVAAAIELLDAIRAKLVTLTKK